jgi:cell division septal protein FtsQ
MKKPNLKAQNNADKRRGLRRYNRTPLTTYYRSETTPGQSSPFTHRTPKTNYSRTFVAIIDVLLVVLLFSGLVYSLIVSSSPKVEAIDTTYHRLNAYQSATDKLFSGFKNRNKLSFDQNEISSKLKSQFPEITAVNIELPFFSQQAKVQLLISKPAFLIANDSKAYVISEQGIAVNESAQLPKLPKLVSVNDQTGFKTRVGQQVLSSQQVHFINEVILQLQAAHVPVSNLTLPPLAQELDLRTTDQLYYVKFYLGGDAQIQAGQLLASRHNFAQANQQPAEYLDVRVPGKIFYK